MDMTNFKDQMKKMFRDMIERYTKRREQLVQSGGKRSELEYIDQCIQRLEWLMSEEKKKGW